MAASALTIQVPPPHVFPLSAEQERTYHLYVAEQGINSWMRDYLFISTDAAARDEFISKIAKGGGIGALIGGITGYFATRFFRKNDESSSNNNMPLKMMGLGAGIGAGVGGCVHANYAHHHITHSPEYKTWRENAIKTQVYPLFKKYLEDSELLQEFMCDIQEDLITDPVRDPNGRVYEKSVILAWLDRKAHEYPPERLVNMSYDERQTALMSFCPRRSGHLTPQMLTPDFDYHRKVAIAVRKQFDQEVNQQFKEGLMSYHIALVKDRESLTREIISDIAAKYASGKLSEEAFYNACKDCRRNYGLSEDS